MKFYVELNDDILEKIDDSISPEEVLDDLITGGLNQIFNGAYGQKAYNLRVESVFGEAFSDHVSSKKGSKEAKEVNE